MCVYILNSFFHQGGNTSRNSESVPPPSDRSQHNQPQYAPLQQYMGQTQTLSHPLVPQLQGFQNDHVVEPTYVPGLHPTPRDEIDAIDPFAERVQTSYRTTEPISPRREYGTQTGESLI